MLQSMRNNLKGTVAIIMVGFLSFILVGGLLQFAGDNSQNRNEVASIDGNTITEINLLRAIEGRRQQLISQLGDQLPPEFLSNERLRSLALENLIDYSLLVNVGLNEQMTVSDQSLNGYIVALPQFQVDGQYSPELLKNWLASMRYTAPGFKKVLKEDIIAGQVRRSLIDSGFVTNDEWSNATRLAFQTRDFTWVTLPLDSLQGQITLTEEEVQTFYDANRTHYLSDEQVAVEYVEVTVDDIVDVITVDDDAIRQQYEQEVAVYEKQIRREAAHILIEDSEGADDRIAKVEADLASGEDFAVLVKRYSDDVGSKNDGGVLGFTTGDIFPAEFEAALSSLTPGQVSSPVNTEAGTHFIKLLSVQENHMSSFAEERQRIEQLLKLSQAEDLFIEIVDALKDLSYNAENLADIAAKISNETITLVTHRTELFTQTSAPGILANSAVNAAVFSDKVTKEGYASDVIEVAEDHAVVIKMIGYQPVRTLTLEEKRSEIETTLRLEKAKSQLAAKAEVLRAALRSGENLKSVATTQGLTVSDRVAIKRDDRETDSNVLDFVFSMSKPVADKSVTDGTHLPNGDYVLVNLSKVEDASLDSLTKEERNNLRDNLALTYSRDEFAAWQSQLRSNADIEVFTEADRAGVL